MKRIPDKCIDMVLTDPPYGLNYNNGDLANIWEKVFGGKKERMVARPIMNDGEEESLIIFEQFLLQANRILNKGCCCCCCCCGGGGPKPLFAKWTLLMDKIIGFKQAVVWDKMGLGMGIHYRRNYEFVLVAQQRGAPCKWNGGNNTPNVFRLGKIIPSSEQHPTVKPVDLMKHFIKLHSNPGDLILDPFLGSGTTAVAAYEMGRRFIGIEKELKYIGIARRRLDAVMSQTKLWG
jgi:DNA modification methylase